MPGPTADHAVGRDRMGKFDLEQGMDEIEDGLQEQLQDRRGKLARIVKGGTLRVGDTVKVI